MFNRNDANIANAVYVLNFRDADTSVRLQQAAAESAFGGIMNGQSVQSNVPDAFDPAAPRIIFNSGERQISISQTACQVTLNFPDTGKFTLDEQWKTIEKNIKDFYSKAMEFKPNASYGMSSLVFQIAFRSDASASELHRWLYDKLIKKDLEGELASVAVQIGYKHGLWYQNVNANVYEKFELKIPALSGPVIRMRLDKFPVKERGVNLTIDINDRPKFQDDSAVCSDPDEIIQLAREFSAKQLDVIVFG